MGYEKFVLDADQLGMWHAFARGVDLSENGRRWTRSDERAGDALPRPSAHARELRAARSTARRWPTTRASSSGRSRAPRTPRRRANTIWKQTLAEYEAPPIDEAVDEELREWIERRKASFPDASRVMGATDAQPRRRACAELLRRSRFEVLPLDGIEEQVLAHVPHDVTLTVTASPTKGLEPTLDLADGSCGHGYTVVPAPLRAARPRHGGARGDRRAAARGRRAGRLRRRRRRRGAARGLPRGDRPARGARRARPAVRRGRHHRLPGEPPVHRRRDDDRGDVREGAPRDLHREPGLLRPGHHRPVDRERLGARHAAADLRRRPRRRAAARSSLRVSTRIGIGDSLRFLRKNGSFAGRFLRGGFSPDPLVDGLGPRAREREGGRLPRLHVQRRRGHRGVAPGAARADRERPVRRRDRRRRLCRLRPREPAQRRPGTSVLVLEAGRPDSLWDVYVHMPAALSFPIGSSFYDWRYESEPEPFMNGRRIYHARGKLLGGSSSINGMIFQRGNPMDFERWAARPGLESWDYAHCLPYFKRMETCLAGADEWRGGDGPLVLERGPASSPLFRRVLRGGAAGRVLAHRDVNGERQEGFAAFDRNIHRGRRLSAARAYLHPVRRPTEPRRADVVRSSRASSSRGRARPASRSSHRGRDRGRARRRGDPLRRRDQLAAAPPALGRRQRRRARGVGVDVVHDLPGVGENLQDHLEVYVQHASTQPVSVAPAMKWRNRPWVGFKWLFFRSGPGATNHFEGGGFVRSNDEVDAPEPHVPLPAARDPLRRLAARRRPRLPGARRPDVLGRPRLGEDHVGRSAREARAPLQLPLDRAGPPRVARGDPLRPLDPRAAGVRAVRRRRALARAGGRDRRGDPRLGRARRRDRAAPLVLVPDGRRRPERRRPVVDAGPRARRVCASSTRPSCRRSRTRTSTRRR